jgi:PAS domain S-box-containing protein
MRTRQGEILVRWEAAVRALPSARRLDRLTLIDDIPEILDHVADLLDHGGSDVGAHPAHGLEEDFDLIEAVSELDTLRDSILGLWQDEVGTSIDVREVRVLDRALDIAVARAVQEFTVPQERSLAAVDGLVSAALESTDLDDLLERLLVVLFETTPAIDTTAILLVENNRLVVRAAVGLERELEKGFSLSFGEGFAGRIAATGQPLSLQMASQNPLIDTPLIRRLGVQALYGVPLIDGDRVIGVAHIGSLSAPDFSAQDKQLFAAVAARATTAIVQHLLRDQLRDRELQLRSLADNIPQLAWMADAVGRVFWVNQRWLSYTGVTGDELQNHGWERVLHSDHADAVHGKLDDAIRTGHPYSTTHPMRGVDGRFRWFHCRGTPIQDEHGGVVRWLQTCTDITEQRFLDEATALLSSSLEYHDTLDRIAKLAVPDLADWCAVDLLDGDDIRRLAIAHLDPAKLELATEYAKRFPITQDTSVRRVITTGAPLFAPALTPEMLRGAYKAEQADMLLDVGIHAAIIVPLTARGRVLGAISLLMADTPRMYKHADVELAMELGRRAGIAVDNARLYREAQEAVRLREDVLAVVSHDLRNPLGAIDLSASMLLQKHHDARARKQLEIIRRSSSRMEALITDLLDMASIEAGRLSLDRTPNDAGKIVAEVVDLHVSLAAEKQIILTSVTSLDGVMILCDRERIAQVFGNLVSNAIKFCRPGDRIEITGKKDGTMARFVVRDTGPGIGAEALPHIFEPYYSAKQHAKQGTGLGLYISKGIIEAHGGTITAESTEGHGATFTITLPLA